MPSLYEFTTPVGDVASGNFTTLYNASGLTVPNAGAGSVSGNLNVGGNLTVQGSSLLIGPVTLQSTLSLPNYTFPNTDGTTYQVLTTDGSGNLTWSSVQTLPGANYSISASTTTGGANLDLVSGITTDSVKFAEGTNIQIVRTDANTITISTVADNIPDGTAAGQVLEWDGSAWTATSTVEATSTSNIFTTKLTNSSTTSPSALDIIRDYSSHAFVNGDRVLQRYSIDSSSQSQTGIGSVGFAYNSTDPTFFATTTVDNYTTNTPVIRANTSTTTLAGTDLTLNYNLTGAPSSNATITVNRGSSTNATITWDETDDRWELNYDLLAPGLQGGNIQIGVTDDNTIYIGGNDLNINTDGSHVIQSNSPIQTTAQSMSINSDNTAADSQLNFKSTTQYLKWNNTTSQFELSDTLFISQTDEPAIFERKKDTTDFSYESKTALKLIQRVTDAPNNNTDDGGANIIFSRTSGASGGAEVQYASIQSDYFGTTNTANIRFLWSDDNFAETSPGSFPGTYDMLKLASDNAKFFNSSIYIDYSTAGSALVGINTDTPAYTLDVNGNAHVSGNVTTGGITAGNITVGVVTDNTISTTSGDLTISPISGSNVTIASSLATNPVIVARVTSNTNTPTRGAILRVNSNGTPAVGLGVGLDFEVETAASTFTSGGNVRVVSTDITPASEDFKMEISLTANGVQSVVATLDNTGTLELDGDLQVDGNDIKSSTGATAITLNASDVSVVGDLAVHASSTDAVIEIGSLTKIITAQTTTSSTATVAIATTGKNSMSGAVTIKDTVTNALHTVNFTALKNGATALLTTYGELYTAAALANFTADISGSNLRLLATPVSSNSTTINTVRTSLD